jgi:ubiquinone/menaquinone biosynthesis C-methylase UbiE
MRTEDKKYFRYITGRSKLSLSLRKFFYSSIIREFKGKLLDVGCGMGEFLEWYKNSYGIDTNRYLVEYCKKRNLKCSFGNAYKIPFNNKTFDSVLCSHLIEHLNRPESAVKEIRRVLKHEGKLIIVIPTEKGYMRDKTHVRFWDKENIEKLLKRFDFHIKKSTYFPTKLLSKYTKLGELRIIAIRD